MSRKKKSLMPVSSREALRRVRKDLPPPVRRQEDDKKYRRPAARRAARQEVETSTEEAQAPIGNGVSTAPQKGITYKLILCPFRQAQRAGP